MASITVDHAANTCTRGIHHASAEEHGGEAKHRRTRGGGEGRGVGEEERLDGGGITSNYRTAKAEARQLVQKFMETWNIVRTL